MNGKSYKWVLNVYNHKQLGSHCESWHDNALLPRPLQTIFRDLSVELYNSRSPVFERSLKHHFVWKMGQEIAYPWKMFKEKVSEPNLG